MTDTAAEPTQRYKVGKRFFIYAPPLKGVRPSKRAQPNPPYKGAPSWKCSVYYYWWEYLRRHDGYRQTCLNDGKGTFAALYADFGNVHAHDDFWRWWSKEAHSELFCEPTARKIRVLDKKSVVEHTLSEHTLIMEVPLEVRSAYLVSWFRKTLSDNAAAAKAAKRISRARYPVTTKPVLTSLHQHLVVWDAYIANPMLKLHELYDLVEHEAGLYVSQVVDGDTVANLKKLDLPYNDLLRIIRNRKANTVKRHLRIAQQYIEHVAQGHFPYRTHR